MPATSIILDTDIGDDIDDTWALAMLLRCPELDVKLITTAFRDTSYRSAVTAKMLTSAGRPDIPVGVGVPRMDERSAFQIQKPWIEDFDLEKSGVEIVDDGVGALIDKVMAADESDPVTIVAIGPMTNMGAALRREPAIADRARIVGMLGSVRRSHYDQHNPQREYNVVMDIPAAQAVLRANWPITLTPLDTCGFVTLDGEKYQRVRACEDPLIRAVFECYQLWDCASDRGGLIDSRSSVLFDTVAIHLAMSERFLKMEDLHLTVDDDGLMRIDASGKLIRCATDWLDLDGFMNELVDRLTTFS